MKLALVVAACLAACSNAQPSLDDLAKRADKMAADEQPILDALVSRVNFLKFNMGHNPPGWENKFRDRADGERHARLAAVRADVAAAAELEAEPDDAARDRPVRSRPGAQARARGQPSRSEFLIEDERRRYDEGVAHVDDLLKQVEQWVAAQPGSASGSGAQ